MQRLILRDSLNGFNFAMENKMKKHRCIYRKRLKLLEKDIEIINKVNTSKAMARTQTAERLAYDRT